MNMIPKHAKKVFKGTVFEVFQWEQKMFNSTTAVFERAQTLEGASLIATVGDKIVILDQKQPTKPWYISLPGGYLDHKNEKPKDGALRELLEETGLKPKSMKLWRVFPGGGRVNTKHHVFIARDCKKIQEQSLDGGGEIIKVKMVSFEQFLKLSENPSFRNRDIIIEMLKARLSKKRTIALKKEIFG